MLIFERHWHYREVRFLGAVGVIGLIIALYLAGGLRLARLEGRGWRTIDLGRLQQRLETGELSEREADWYHPASEEEAAAMGDGP
jgi:hypothetical protein